MDERKRGKEWSVHGVRGGNLSVQVGDLGSPMAVGLICHATEKDAMCDKSMIEGDCSVSNQGRCLLDWDACP